jgi:hypothetical protein
VLSDHLGSSCEVPTAAKDWLLMAQNSQRFLSWSRPQGSSPLKRIQIETKDRSGLEKTRIFRKRESIAYVCYPWSSLVLSGHKGI